MLKYLQFFWICVLVKQILGDNAFSCKYSSNYISCFLIIFMTTEEQFVKVLTILLNLLFLWNKSLGIYAFCGKDISEQLYLFVLNILRTIIELNSELLRNSELWIFGLLKYRGRGHSFRYHTCSVLCIKRIFIWISD